MHLAPVFVELARRHPLLRVHAAYTDRFVDLVGEADNGEAPLAAALAGLGVAALPDFMTEPHVASGARAAVLTDYPRPTQECTSFGRLVIPRARYGC